MTSTDWMSPEELKPKLEPGDLIAFKRPTYQHWAVWVGEQEGGVGDIIHLDGPDFITKRETAEIQYGSFESVAGTDKVAKDNRADRFNSKFYPEDIVARAKDSLGTKPGYKLTSVNCESFCKWCRNGVLHTKQGAAPIWVVVCAIIGGFAGAGLAVGVATGVFAAPLGIALGAGLGIGLVSGSLIGSALYGLTCLRNSYISYRAVRNAYGTSLNPKYLDAVQSNKPPWDRCFRRSPPQPANEEEGIPLENVTEI